MGQNWHNEILNPAGCILLALWVLVMPLRWVLAWIVAVAVHECGHLAAVRLCGGRIIGLRLDPSGASISAEGLGDRQELLCVLAGPFFALAVLVPLAKWIPATAVCAVFQSAYNLLPLRTLDGGRALRCGFGLLLGPVTADRICKIVHWVCLALVTATALYASVFLKLGILPTILALWLMIQGNFGKIPCKPRRQRVQ